MVEGCTAAYAIPVDHCAEFEEFIHELRRLEVAEDARIYWSTCFQGGRITSEWFNSQQGEWVFRWEDWVKEVKSQSTVLPYTLMEPASFPICADDIDVQILMKMEADGTRSLKQIAEMLGISRQLAQFHYREHMLGRSLIEGYEVFVKRYGDSPSVMVYFVVSFHSYETFARFARSLIDKPFAITLGKVLGENALIFEVTLTTYEFRNFVDAMSRLARTRLVKSYRYAMQDLRIRSRQTFSGEFFKEKSWFYDHKGHMETLQQKASMLTRHT
jgi:DNA-binding Lrp family transcriptional regulator